MLQEEFHPAHFGNLVYFDPWGEHVDCVHMPGCDRILITANILHVRGKGYDNSDVNDGMMAVVDAFQALASKGDVVFDYDRSFAKEVTDLEEAQDALYKNEGMHTLVGRSADRSTLFLVFAPTTQTRVAVGLVKRRQ
jgi:hypothetical protein